MTLLESITRDGRLHALIIRAGYHREGIEFFTPPELSQQLGYMNRPQGHVIAPHVHNHLVREVSLTSEVLLVRSGKVRVDFYDDAHAYLESRVLAAGDTILLAAGGHGFEMIEPSELIEIKQGPHAGDADKTVFAPVASDRIRLPD